MKPEEVEVGKGPKTVLTTRARGMQVGKVGDVSLKGLGGMVPRKVSFAKPPMVPFHRSLEPAPPLTKMMRSVVPESKEVRRREMPLGGESRRLVRGIRRRLRSY